MPASNEPSTVERATFDALLVQFDRAVRALCDAGQSDEACRIAAAAWSATHRESRRADRRLTATLHYLVLPQGSAHTTQPATKGAP